MDPMKNPIWQSLFKKLLADYLLGVVTREEMLLFMNMTTDIQVNEIVNRVIREGLRRG